jgi:hypothetical protein
MSFEACGKWGQPYTSDIYERFRSWGLNSILYIMHWSMIEPYAAQPGIYDEPLLRELEAQVLMAEDQGLYPFVGLRGPYNNKGESWRGWMDEYGWDLINLNLKVPDTDIGGRDRYINCLKMLAQRFPNSGIYVTFFPYHQDTVSTEEIATLYTVTLPRLYTSVRSLTDEYIQLYPLYQGAGGNRSNILSTWQYRYIDQYGWTPFPNVTSDPRLILGFNNHSGDGLLITDGKAWDYNISRVEEHYAPLLTFKESNPSHVLYGCAESTPLNVHSIYNSSGYYFDNTVRPILQSRLDWMRTHLKIMSQEDLSWWYFVFRNDAEWASPVEGPIHTGGADNAIAILIQEYA